VPALRHQSGDTGQQGIGIAAATAGAQRRLLIASHLAGEIQSTAQQVQERAPPVHGEQCTLCSRDPQIMPTNMRGFMQQQITQRGRGQGGCHRGRHQNARRPQANHHRPRGDIG